MTDRTGWVRVLLSQGRTTLVSAQSFGDAAAQAEPIYGSERIIRSEWVPLPRAAA